MDFNHDKNISLEKILELAKSYIPNFDPDLITKAYFFAKTSHEGQKRSSGEDFFIHPANVAYSVAKLRMDQDSIIAAFLHDVIEDCGVTEDDLVKEFSKEIATIVVGLTKISKIPFKTQRESQVENFRKMVVAMAHDLRVIIVKLCDRIHNMLTLQYVAPEKQLSKAQETLDIYVPLANRLGIHAVKAELEDLCLRYLRPQMYQDIAKYISTKKEDREKYIRGTVSILDELLKKYQIKGAIKGRPKHFYSIYKKMITQNLQFDEVQDLLAFRIIVDNIGDCYKCLGIIHSSYTPVPGRFKDYIAIPKINKYQSLHTTVIGPQAERIEIQIRTKEMDHIAEHGIAAHWKYKESDFSGKINWINELIEFNSNSDSTDLIDIVKNDLNIEGVFVFTPQGEVMELSQGATALDFAYTIHTEVGNHCIGAKVNGRIVPLKYRLHSGDSVQIITNKGHHPNKDWLKIAQTGRAKSKIRQWLQKVEKEENTELGKELLDRGLKLFNLTFKTVNKGEEFNKLAKKYNYPLKDDLFAAIGAGKLDANNVMAQLPELQGASETQIEKKIKVPLSQKMAQGIHSSNPIIVDGMDDIMVRLARCCTPIPGDPIIGHITRGRGITVHTTNCPTLEKVEFGRNIEVYWNNDLKFKHPVSIRILTIDRPGMLSNLSQIITQTGINIKTALARSLPDTKGSFIFEIEVSDYSELLKVIRVIESTKDVISVSRASAVS